MNKLINWIFESNRPKHFVAGCIVAIVTFVLASFIIGAWNLRSATFAAYTTLVVAVSVEYKDHLWGGKFDVLDILATCIFSVVLWICYLIDKLI